MGTGLITRGEEETERYGAALARLLRSDDTVWLYGELGAGKTALTRGLAQGLGIARRVTSPTFAIANFYEGPVPLAHYDAYRLRDGDELARTGWDELPGAVRVAEWAERAGADIGGICVMIDRIGETEREIHLCYLP